MSDFLEVEVFLEDDVSVDVYVHYADRSLELLRSVSTNIVRYHGVWSVEYEQFGEIMTAHFPAETVRYFSTRRRGAEEYFHYIGDDAGEFFDEGLNAGEGDNDD